MTQHSTARDRRLLCSRGRPLRGSDTSVQKMRRRKRSGTSPRHGAKALKQGLAVAVKDKGQSSWSTVNEGAVQENGR